MKIFLYFVFFTCSYICIESQSLPSQLQLQKAMYQEHILGNPKSALEIYQELIKKDDIPLNIQAQIRLQIALCYEKIGDQEEAQKNYSSLISDYPQFTNLTHWANIRTWEYQRRNQINTLKEQLRELQDSNVKEKLENEIRKLQERIRELEKQTKEDPNFNKEYLIKDNKTPEIPKTTTSEPVSGSNNIKIEAPSLPQNSLLIKKDVLVDSDKDIRDALSMHLFNIGNNLYQQGLLFGARENLLKSLEFNTQNERAKELIKKLDAMIMYRESLSIQSSNDISKKPITIAEPSPTLFFWGSQPTAKENPSLITQQYDCQELFVKWKVNPESIPESIWSENLLQICQSFFTANYWSMPTRISYQNGKIVVSQTIAGHEKFKQFWNELANQTKILSSKAILFYEPSKFHYGNLVFVPTNSGIFYSGCSQSEKEKWWHQISQEATKEILQEFSPSYIFPEHKIQWNHIRNFPLVQGIEEQNLIFQIYPEGISLTLQSIEINKIRVQITVKKISRPVPTIHTIKGPVQLPCSLSQQEEIELSLDQTQNFLIGGMINIGKNRRQENQINSLSSNIFLLLEFLPQTIVEFLSQKRIPLDTKSIENKQVVRRFDISFLQKIQEPQQDIVVLTLESRNQFILRCFKEQLGDFSGTLEIFKESLLVMAPLEIQEKVEKILQQFQQQKRVLCQISLYLLSSPPKSFDNLLEYCKISKLATKGIQIYSGNQLDSSHINFLKEFSDVKIEYNLPPFWLGNTQLGIVRNYQYHSIVDSLNCSQSESFWQSQFGGITEGIVIACRPIILSENQFTLELQTNLYSITGERGNVFNIQDALKLFAKQWEQNIQRSKINISCQNNQFYILSNFTEESSQRKFFLLIIPELKRAEIIPEMELKKEENK